MSSFWEKVIADARLLSLPEAFLQLKAVLEQADYSMAEVAMPISQDPALTARLLRLVNSSYYGFPNKIDTVFRAVTIIGSQQVYDLALATAVAHTFNHMDSRIMDMTEFWRHSVCCGILAKNLASACDNADDERLFVAGLLHDIGHLIMYQSIPEQSQQAILQSHHTDQPLATVERETIGLDYTRVGGALMRQWGLPGYLRESTEFHLQPERAMLFPMETYLVHIAVKLSNMGNAGYPSNDEGLQLDSHALAITGLSMEQCLDAKQQSEQDVMTVLESFFPLKRAG